MNQFATFVLFVFLTISTQAQLALESWRSHFPYANAISVVSGNDRVYYANAHMVYTVNLNDNSIETLTKVNQLSDVLISSIDLDVSTNTLVVGYENGNIDLIRNGKPFNMRAILNSSIFGVKRINNIYTENGKAYLSCGFGIVYINLVDREVIDTYIIGPGGSNLQVYDVTKHNGKIYAATDIGLFEADENNSFLANFANWSRVETLPNYTEPLIQVVSFGNNLFVAQRNDGADDKVYGSENTVDWFEQMSEGTIRGIDLSGNRMIVKAGLFVRAYFENSVEDFTVYYGFLEDRLLCNGVAITSPGEAWLGDERRGLMRVDLDTGERTYVRPMTPKHLDSYRVQVIDDLLFKLSGTPSSNWSSSFNPRGLEVLLDDEWVTYDNEVQFIAENNIRDLMVVAVDPEDDNHWYVGTWGFGLLEFQNGEIINQFTESNSLLQGSAETNGPAIAGLLFDSDNNLWITNGYSETPLLVISPEGDWTALSAVNAGAGGNDLYADMIISQLGYKWIVRPRGHGLVVYNDNNTPFDDTDDEAVAITNQAGQGNLPTMDVFSIAEDLNGEIWVGTGEGVAVFYNSGGVFSGNNFDAQQILLEQDGNIQILLETENVTSIQVDGANRKWLGTSNSGVFLMSPDGTEEIYHFTSTNSPLPSNSIRSIAIDGESGEVFFGTDQGVVSFKSTASDGEASNTCSKVYPNPVRENYDGPIAIEGLERNTNVKITDVAGNLVYETTSEGGRAIWDGRTIRGERVTTGVYTALCISPEANSKCVAKIMVIR